MVDLKDIRYDEVDVLYMLLCPCKLNNFLYAIDFIEYIKFICLCFLHYIVLKSYINIVERNSSIYTV